MKKTSNAFAAFCLLNSVNVFALGLGEIQTSSALNQILNAKIPLLSSKNEDPSNIRVHIASKEVFDKAGLDRPVHLNKLNFTPVVNKTGDILIEVQSTSTIKEPFVNFILEVEWPQGRTLKEFTILLDPPVTMSSVQTTPVKLAKVPTLTKAPVKKEFTPRITNQSAQSSEYGPVGRLDTLWSITKKLHASNGSAVSHNQMMLALFENNPEAFYMNNINALKKGAILKVPSVEEIAQRTASQANNEYRKQNTLWSTSTKANNSSVKKEASTAIKKAALPSKNLVKSELSLLTPKQKDSSRFTAEENSSSDSANESNAAANANIAIEMATTLEEENKDVKSRLNEVEAQVANLQRLLTLKDKQLKRLQSNASKKAKDVPTKKDTQAPTKEDIKDSGSDDNLALYGGGLVLALLALFLIRRRKEKTATVDDLSVIEESVSAPDTTKEVLQENTPDDTAEVIEEALSPEDSDTQPADAADPIDECDVYIAYGRYQQAEDVIKIALADDPENLKYKLKLIDVYFASSNAAAFEELANSLVELKDSDAETWTSIAEMGEELCPDSSLFLAPLHEETFSEKASLDVENTINFEVPVNEISEKEMQTDTKDEFEFDFSLIDTDKSPEAEETLEQPIEPLDITFTDDMDKSPIGTKLSLAEAYVEMSDIESARETLNEVIESGSEAEKKEAQERLNKL